MDWTQDVMAWKAQLDAKLTLLNQATAAVNQVAAAFPPPPTPPPASTIPALSLTINSVDGRDNSINTTPGGLQAYKYCVDGLWQTWVINATGGQCVKDARAASPGIKLGLYIIQDPGDMEFNPVDPVRAAASMMDYITRFGLEYIFVDGPSASGGYDPLGWIKAFKAGVTVPVYTNSTPSYSFQRGTGNPVPIDQGVNDNDILAVVDGTCLEVPNNSTGIFGGEPVLGWQLFMARRNRLAGKRFDLSTSWTSDENLRQYWHAFYMLIAGPGVFWERQGWWTSPNPDPAGFVQYPTTLALQLGQPLELMQFAGQDWTGVYQEGVYSRRYEHGLVSLDTVAQTHSITQQ